MGYLEKLDPSGWTALQVFNFMEKIHLHGNIYEIPDIIGQIDSIQVCKGIILQLIKENQSLREQKGGRDGKEICRKTF